MKLLVFLHGTTIMHQAAIGRSREERVRQVRERDASVKDYATYVPVGNAVDKKDGCSFASLVKATQRWRSGRCLMC